MLSTFLLVAAGSVHAQSVSGDVSFNLFRLEGLTVSDIFTFDDAFAEKHGIEVPVPFSIRSPRDPRILRIVDGKPSGGAFVKFTFGLEARAEEAPAFLENLQITPATLPLFEDSEDPALARQRSAVVLARDHVFPRMVEGHDRPEILTVETLALGDVAAVQLIGRYVEKSIGPMLLRVVILPHPRQEKSLIAVANINLARAYFRDHTSSC